MILFPVEQCGGSRATGTPSRVRQLILGRPGNSTLSGSPQLSRRLCWDQRRGPDLGIAWAADLTCSDGGCHERYGIATAQCDSAVAH